MYVFPLYIRELTGACHFSLHIEEHRGDIKFSYCNSDASKTLLMEVENSKAYVTAIHYVPQLLTLFIGYNFGGFQLYNLRISDIV